MAMTYPLPAGFSHGGGAGRSGAPSPPIPHAMLHSANQQRLAYNAYVTAQLACSGSAAPVLVEQVSQTTRGCEKRPSCVSPYSTRGGSGAGLFKTDESR
jgi:hypothetical protein